MKKIFLINHKGFQKIGIMFGLFCLVLLFGNNPIQSSFYFLIYNDNPPDVNFLFKYLYLNYRMVLLLFSSEILIGLFILIIGVLVQIIFFIIFYLFYNFIVMRFIKKNWWKKHSSSDHFRVSRLRSNFVVNFVDRFLLKTIDIIR